MNERQPTARPTELTPVEPRAPCRSTPLRRDGRAVRRVQQPIRAVHSSGCAGDRVARARGIGLVDSKRCTGSPQRAVSRVANDKI